MASREMCQGRLWLEKRTLLLLSIVKGSSVIIFENALFQLGYELR